jgi:hypothetical protein
LLKLPECHESAILRPRGPRAGQAVTLFAEEEETGVYYGLTRNRGIVEAFYGRLRNAIHEAKVFMPGFCRRTSLTL